MGSLVRFIMRSRTHAISVAVLGMLVPPFSFVSGGIIAQLPPSIPSLLVPPSKRALFDL